uniref:uncharacterized protein n=1 Tax=Pristiophorus japonicus TaxID=55135 RepID=UPI00398F48D6
MPALASDAHIPGLDIRLLKVNESAISSKVIHYGRACEIVRFEAPWLLTEMERQLISGTATRSMALGRGRTGFKGSARAQRVNGGSQILTIQFVVLLLIQLSGAHTQNNKTTVPPTSISDAQVDEDFAGNVMAVTVTAQEAAQNQTMDHQTLTNGLGMSQTPAPPDVSQNSPVTSGQFRVDLKTQEGGEYETESPETDTPSDWLRDSSSTRSRDRVTVTELQEDDMPDMDGSGDVLDAPKADVDSEVEYGIETNADVPEILEEDQQRQRLLIILAILLPIGILLVIMVVLLLKKFYPTDQNSTRSYTLTAVNPQ